jgi:hypothetical protein
MEIVLIATGIVALAGLAMLTMRRRSVRGRRSRAARQWRGSSSAAAVRARRERPVAAAAGVAAGSVAYMSIGGSGGGTAVQDPPRTQTEEPDLDGWDDDLEWTDDLDASPQFERTEAAAAVEPPPVYEPPVPEPAPPAAAPPEAPPAPEAEPAGAHLVSLPPAVPEPVHESDDGDWEDDLYARPDGHPAPIPSARGAAAFGAATATPPGRAAVEARSAARSCSPRSTPASASRSWCSSPRCWPRA